MRRQRKSSDDDVRDISEAERQEEEREAREISERVRRFLDEQDGGSGVEG